MYPDHHLLDPSGKVRRSDKFQRLTAFERGPQMQHSFRVTACAAAKGARATCSRSQPPKPKPTQCPRLPPTLWLGPRRTPVGGAAPALKSERPLADCFKCSRSSRPLQGKQKRDGCGDTRHNTEHGSRWMFAVSLHLDPDPQRDGESLVTPDSKCELYHGTVL
jgi:hypothetical protein